MSWTSPAQDLTFMREKLLIDLGKLASRDTMLVYVTHHIEEIIPLFTHVALVHDGQITAAGPKEEVLNKELLSQITIGQLKWIG